MSKVSPIVTPTLSSPLDLRRVSTSSVQSFASAIASAASSVSSIPFEAEAIPVKAEGLQDTSVVLDARQYKKPSFVTQLLECIRALNIPSWSNRKITVQDIDINRVSGSLTNAVFFVSCPSVKGALTLLLRIYGPSSGSLISRPRELHTLHILSSRYNLGPKVYGTFGNGRLEEYFPSKTLTAEDMRDPQTSRWIGARMAELHSVPIDVVEETSPKNGGEGKGWELGAKKNVRSWIAPARDVVMHPNMPQSIRDEIDLDKFLLLWESYLKWLSSVDDVHNGSRRVFAHNDTQYGNLLRLEGVKVGAPPHRQLIVVDFEYASPNSASFDIANHFHEWTYNYHSSTPHLPDESRYPTRQERENFYFSYLEHAGTSSHTPISQQAKHLEEQVRYWSPACHAMWCMWGLVQARDDVIGNVAEPEFDYVGYSRARMAAFQRSIAALGVI